MRCIGKDFFSSNTVLKLRQTDMCLLYGNTYIVRHILAMMMMSRFRRLRGKEELHNLLMTLRAAVEAAKGRERERECFIEGTLLLH